MPTKSEQLDSTDKEIIKILKQNARLKNTEIARMLGLTEGAIRKRIKRLEEKGIIKKYTIEVNETAKGINALIFIYLKEGANPDKILEKIMDMNDISEGWEVTGETDLVVTLSTDAPEEMQPIIARIREIKGVERTVTHVILKHVVKTRATKE